MKLNTACMSCIIRRAHERIAAQPDEEKKLRYMKELLRVVSEADEAYSAPALTEKTSEVYRKYFGEDTDFTALKASYNAMLLEAEPGVRARIGLEDDPLKAALLFARAGNYIDFGAMGSVSDEKLHTLLDGAMDEQLNPPTYRALLADLQHAARLLYITDNCGEIVLDKIVIDEIMKRYPHLRVTVLVRGGPVYNDATLEDARQAGLTERVPVVGNGTGIPGTEIPLVSEEAKTLLQEADVIIAKGQGNFESLHGCGLNIYYLFLCKCDWFVQRFHLKRFSGVLINEKDQRLR